jgi:hypothetical protein
MKKFSGEIKSGGFGWSVRTENIDWAGKQKRDQLEGGFNRSLNSQYIKWR